MTDSQHTGDDCLERYHLGLLGDEAELRRVERHLSVCPACRDRAKKVENDVTILRYGAAARPDSSSS